MKLRRIIGGVAALVLGVSLLSAVAPDEPADAANPALWNPGYIISDALFYDGGAMNGDQVEAFVLQKNAGCQAGYTCLGQYWQATPSLAASSLCGAYAGSAGERAADIIAKVGAACRISQKALLVLLEKEQGLVSIRNPSASRFSHATGFACPDTAPCDPAFAGFFYQVYYAARQFQKYAATPTSWNYQAGRVNNILFNPNAGCGTSPVYINNKATAGLYIYTPYQPNAAALANLYGTGDGCSAYGNRNFWRIYSDWFGSPTESSSLLRTTDNATVYLIAGDSKYPVPNISVLSSLAPLGQVSYVSQSYLNAFTTSHVVGRNIRDPGGTIYFYDAGVKLPYTSCAQAVDYGSSCANTGYVQLTQAQADAFATGHALTSVIGTREGGRYLVKSGTKAEILDAQSQSDAGITDAMNVVTEAAIAHLVYAPPIIRDGAFVLTRGTSNYSLLSGGQRYTVPPASASGLGITTRATGSLWGGSLNLIPASATQFTGLVQVAGVNQVVSSTGRYVLNAGGLVASAAPVPVSDALLATYPSVGTIDVATFFKSTATATVYVVMPSDIRPIDNWDSLIALTPTGQNPVILTVSPSVIALFPVGPMSITSGKLVRSPQDATVWLIDGVSTKIPLTSFVEATEAGYSGFVYAGQSRIDAYPRATGALGYGIACGAVRYVSAGGKVHPVPDALVPLYPFKYIAFDQFSCARLKVGVPATTLIQIPNGAIYYLADGQKHWVASTDRLAVVAPGQSWLTVTTGFASAIPTGAPA